ncbi:DNase I-like protein [Aureobasidium sp. EXF-12298]|nr:DNase I-like protein [Aureobasidium sp. EXF-12298]
MSSTKSSRPTSTSSSLMQEVVNSLPGGYPESIQPPTSNQQSLSQAVYGRRSEYTRPRDIKIKVGTWNAAAYKGAEKDIAWFVDGKGIAEGLTDLTVSDDSESQDDAIAQNKDSLDDREGVEDQEARYAKKKSTLPQNDPGLLPGGNDIGLYLLGLQEIVDVNSAAEALRPYTDSSVAQKWKSEMEAHLPRGYKFIAEQQLIGMLLLIYASEDVAADIKSVSTTSVGTGLMGYMGNKGAVTARIVLGETTRLVFVNAHLAAGTDKGAVERRNWDYGQVMSRTKFEPITDSMGLAQNVGEGIDDADIAFFVGDLNYRLEGIPGEDVRRLLMLHTRNEYDLSKKQSKKVDKEIANKRASIERRRESRMSTDSGVSQVSTVRSRDDEVSKEEEEFDEENALDPASDPASLHTTLSSLLPHDELQQQQKARKAFQGWQEGPITFLPTYKYDAGSVGVFDSSEKRRAPSWCDRILWRTRRDMLAHESAIAEEEDSRKKDEEMKNSGLDEAGKDEEMLYDYDPDEDADEAGSYDDAYEDAPEGTVITKEGFADEISLEAYVAHQRVLSSDHKPLDAVFSFKYDAVVPELKSKIHQEVARELDRAENEGRPNVTVIADRPHSDEEGISDDDPLKFEGVWFGQVRYAMHKHRSLTIANTGQVPATVYFIDRPVGPGQHPGVCPNWVSLQIDDGNGKLSPDTGKRTLEPGQTFNVGLDLRILDVSLARDFNEGVKSMEDILVLRVENGRDHFIPLRGVWLESSLGHSISKLIRIPEGGIRKLQRQRPDSGKHKSGSVSSGSVLDDDEAIPVRWSAPRELFRLTEVIEELSVRVTAEWGMLNDSTTPPPWERFPGWPFAQASWTFDDNTQRADILADIAEALDSDSSFDSALPPTLTHIQKLECLAEFLLLFLKAMTDGIVTPKLWHTLDDNLRKQEKLKSSQQASTEDLRTWAQEILSSSPSHSISFILVTSMLDRISSEIISTIQHNHPEVLAKPPSADFLASIPVWLRKKLPKEGKEAWRLGVLRGVAGVMASRMIRSDEGGENAKEKERQVVEERKVRFLELFMG